ncbi:hypothetical protein OJE16_09415 [Pantoea tagorei]
MSLIVDTFIAPPCPEEIETLYQDAHLVLINKPAGCSACRGKIPLTLTRYTIGWRRFFPALPWCIGSISVPLG